MFLASFGAFLTIVAAQTCQSDWSEFVVRDGGQEFFHIDKQTARVTLKDSSLHVDGFNVGE